MAEIGQKTDFTLKFIIVGNRSLENQIILIDFQKVYLLKNIKL